MPRSRRDGSRVGPDDDRVCNQGDLVGRHPDTLGVVADRLGAARLVDADGAEAAVVLLDHVAADPADVVRHLLVADSLRLRGGRLELVGADPSVASPDHVGVHKLPLFPSVSAPSAPIRVRWAKLRARESAYNG